ncbi:MAG: hypothetical protein HYY40_10405 [Bacteroidetes bacterium]|nr:hypothetical protein [Bacteroidota bacterium]
MENDPTRQEAGPVFSPRVGVPGTGANGESEIRNAAMGEEFGISNILLFLWIWRRPLLLVTFLACILSLIFSSPFFIPPKFKSTVILFPTTGRAISKALLSENPGSTKDILEFGDEEQAEQMLQILNSIEIKNRVFHKYNLMNHYGIDTTAEYPLTELAEEYEDNIHFKRTEYMSVVIEVYDTDPIVAANIANDISTLLDTVRNRISKLRAMKGLSVVENEYHELNNQIAKMEDSLRVLRNFGIHDYESQSAVLNEQYGIAIAKGDQRAVKALEEKLSVLAQYGGAYVSLRDRLTYETERLSVLRTKYVEARVDAAHTLPHKFVVDPAYPAEKKSYPIRWLIAVISTVSAFILCIITILLIQKIQTIYVRYRP